MICQTCKTQNAETTMTPIASMIYHCGTCGTVVKMYVSLSIEPITLVPILANEFARRLKEERRCG